MEREEIQGKVELVRQLIRLIQKKRKNEREIPKDLLHTKYKQAYQKLLRQIRDVAEQLAAYKLAEGVVIRDDEEGMRLATQMRKVISEKLNNGAMDALDQALVKDGDIDGWMRIIEVLRMQIWELYRPYWSAYCCLYVTRECLEEGREPRIYNELTEEFLVDDACNIWERHPEWNEEKAVCKIFFRDE